MNTNKLLDAYKAHHGIESDYALAARLHVTRATVHHWRRLGMPERIAFQFAIELKLDPAAILAAVRADHAHDPAIKKTWEKVAKTMANRAALWLVMVLALAVLAGPRVLSAAVSELNNNIHYTNWRRKKSRVFAYFLCNFGSIFARFLHHPRQLKLI